MLGAACNSMQHVAEPENSVRPTISNNAALFQMCSADCTTPNSSVDKPKQNLELEKEKSEELSAQHGTKVLEAFGKFWKRSAEPRTCADDTDLSDGASYTVIRYYFDVVKQKISGSLTKVLGNW